jgi:hypothetical protein
MALYRLLEKDSTTARLNITNFDRTTYYLPNNNEQTWSTPNEEHEKRTFFGTEYYIKRRYSFIKDKDKLNILIVEYRVEDSKGNLLAGGDKKLTSSTETSTEINGGDAEDQIIPPEVFNCDN